jgi:hypothetical protein
MRGGLVALAAAPRAARLHTYSMFSVACLAVFIAVAHFQ